MKVSSKENYSLQKNNIAYPSEKSKLFLKINKKIECIYKIAGNDAHIWRRTQDGGCGRLKNAIS